MRHRRGFTMVELLMVISIVMVLLTTLLPAMTKSRDAATHLFCMANLNQIGIITQTYADDFDGEFPEFFFDFGPGASGSINILVQPKRADANGWSYFIPPIRICGFDDDPTGVPVKLDDGSVVYEEVSYGYNIEVIIRDMKDWRVNDYMATDNFALFWDGSMGSDKNDNKKNIQGHYFSAYDFANRTFRLRHYNQTGNVLFLDGHVENRVYIDESEVLLDGVLSGQGNGNGGQGGNGGGNGNGNGGGN